MSNNSVQKDLIVLLVEDSRLARMMVLKILTQQVKKVYVAQDGEEALEKVKLYEPDILITDIELPKKNGLQLAREAKELKYDLQVVIVSSFNEPQYYQEAIDIGVAKYVLKPCSIETITAVIDICEQRIIKEQTALKDATILRLLRQAIDQNTSMVAISDFSGNFIYVNSKFTESTGYTSEDTLENPLQFLRTGRIPEATINQLWEKLISGQEWRGELENKKPNANVYWESISITPIKNLAGEYTHFVTIKEDITQKKYMEHQLTGAYLELEQRVQDRTAELLKTNQQLYQEISERKQIEKAVLEAYELNQKLIASITSILIGVSSDNKITHWNHQAEITFGIQTAEAVGHQFNDLPINWNWERVIFEIEGLRKKGASAYLSDIHYQRPDHSDGLLGFSFNLLSKDSTNNSSYILLGTDITNRKNLEAQTIFAQKMESIGQLAAGIAHEINTPVQYVGDNLHFLIEAFDSRNKLFLKYTDLLEAVKQARLFEEFVSEIENAIAAIELDYINEETQKALEQSIEGVERISKIVRTLKEFSHPSQGEKIFSDINKALENTFIISRNEWKYVAELHIEYAPDLPLVNCLIDSINQALLNIIVNAADAIREKAEQNQTKNTAIEKGVIGAKTWSNGSSVYISISDTGGGIPQTIINKIFDPFFTTKEVGKGTGQGLTIAHDIIVKKHKGNITVSSEVGQGTTFTIKLPIDSD